ncbi:MAG: hypothetical protein WKF96_01260 [Solirubrobacteraceae bacterium]
MPTTIIVPDRVLEQRLTALAYANEVRMKRAALKRAVADGSTTVAEVIRTVPWYAATMALGELLGSQYQWGVCRVSRFLADVGIGEMKRVGALTERQRLVLAGRL